MSFRLVPKSVTLNGLERRNGYFKEFGSFRGTMRKSGWRWRGKKVYVLYLISWWVSKFLVQTVAVTLLSGLRKAYPWEEPFT